MASIKELEDLVSQLSCNISDERFSSEIRKILTKIAQIQSCQTKLVEKRIDLMRENEELRDEIEALKTEIVNPSVVKNF
jgi:hypothetical protein